MPRALSKFENMTMKYAWFKLKALNKFENMTMKYEVEGPCILCSFFNSAKGLRM